MLRYETKTYPTPCMSMYCGHIPTDPECLACSCRQALDEFKAWKARSHAQPLRPDALIYQGIVNDPDNGVQPDPRARELLDFCAEYPVAEQEEIESGIR